MGRNLDDTTSTRACSDFADMTAPSLVEMEQVAQQAFTRLPALFRDRCAGVVIKVEDFPDDETLKVMGAQSPFDLLGLFRGHGLAQQGATLETGQMPNMVFLYRRPILDYWADHEETFGGIVTHVLVHEIGHHLGLSDDDMAEIERGAG